MRSSIIKFAPDHLNAPLSIDDYSQILSVTVDLNLHITLLFVLPTISWFFLRLLTQSKVIEHF